MVSLEPSSFVSFAFFDLFVFFDVSSVPLSLETLHMLLFLGALLSYFLQELLCSFF